MIPSVKCINFIANFEGFEPIPKNNGVDKYLTVGYGHVVQKGEKFEKPLTKAEALKMLSHEVEVKYALPVNKFIAKYKLILSQNQFDALVSFTYNVGSGWMVASTLRKLLIAKSKNAVSIINAFTAWNKCGGKVIAGLTRRRIQEAEMFLKNDYKI